MTTANIAADLLPLAQPIDTLHEMPGNPRRGDIEAVARSYERFGQRKPIVARRDGTVIAGNHQLKAARRLGWDRIAVIYTDDDEQTAKAYALADNRTSELGEIDPTALADMISSVDDLALLADAGYNETDLAALLDNVASVTELPDAVDEPEPVAAGPAKTIRGDVWLLGPHRLLCGDSTMLDDMQRVMGDGLADMVWTDPPYGVSVNAVQSVEEAKLLHRRTDGLLVPNDDKTPDELHQFLTDALGNAAALCRPGAAWFVASPAGPLFLEFGRVLADLGIWRQTLVWLKQSLVMGRSDYHYRHESLFYGWKPGDAHTPPPDRTQDTIWECDRPSSSKEHPTMKPVELVTRAINNHTTKGNLILDPFGGSGSTLIASHFTGRINRSIELDEHYCDVICRRWQRMTGIRPIAEATGNEHDFLAE